MHITTVINGRQVSREQILIWEERRISAAARKLKVPEPGPGRVHDRREHLLDSKMSLGEEEIQRRLARNTRYADTVARISAQATSKRSISMIDIHVDGADASEFVTWFEKAPDLDTAAMLRACPDHFLIRTGPGGQEVLETTGGSPLASLFTINYEDTSSLLTPKDPSFPLQLAGVARSSKGTPIGGVRHQFKDTAAGFHGRLLVEFPFPSLPTMVPGHRWHLACEFSNWAEMAVR